ncbi:hypothetical protein [Glaciibacter psychrotolerans]|uniref:Uncharacterized protein n=1 Tax=Glaciibacter psychrotolerans TaxID=670054 RepID=A0A7Z0EEH3_9MICO|nr:hypothetical protein [Leifsonia psychrotolerans]NYJ20169.1 hypothetical protein [Leifsonia psychrotolerans]
MTRPPAEADRVVSDMSHPVAEPGTRAQSGLDGPSAAPPPESFRRPARTERAVRLDQTVLGGRHLGIGIALSDGFITLFLLWRFAIQWPEYTNPIWSSAAWVLVGLVIALFIASQRALSPRVPRAFLTAFYVTAAVVVAFDLYGSHGLRDAGVFPTAAASIGAILGGLVTFERRRTIIIATAILAVVMTTVAVFEPRVLAQTIAPEILVISLAVLAPVVALGIERTFRRIVQLELDLVLVQSTVTQPQYAVGMLASERLAALDLAAETLLDDVAQGRAALPLPARESTTAASLATALRMHLIEGRTETWLHHAITESEFLGPSVTVHDPSGLAGLLAPAQRDALLLTIWLLISDADHPATAVSLAFGPILPSTRNIRQRFVRFPIDLTTKGVPRRRVDPETWHAIRVVGTHLDTVQDGSLRVEIECSVDNPADV